VTLKDAFLELGFDADRHFSMMARLGRRERLTSADEMLSDVKSRGRKLLMQHHPDACDQKDQGELSRRTAKSALITQAVSVVESETAKFRKKLEEAMAEAAERAGQRTLIVKDY